MAQDQPSTTKDAETGREDASPFAVFGTVEDWARRYIETTRLSEKIAVGRLLPSDLDELRFAPPPVTGASGEDAWALSPGRPPELTVEARRSKTPKPGALSKAKARAQILHVFWHHELQAAELMCWAILAFPDTPVAFRRGLVRVHRDEVRHMAMYQAHIESLGFALGDFPVRDWFWERIPSCQTPTQFVATMGLGFEAGNLEHSHLFAARFREAGDEVGAAIQEQVGREEVAHVKFAAEWFRHFEGELTFEKWQAALPPPLSPMLMRGKPMRHDLRTLAGLPEAFNEGVERYEPV